MKNTVSNHVPSILIVHNTFDFGIFHGLPDDPASIKTLSLDFAAIENMSSGSLAKNRFSLQDIIYQSALEDSDLVYILTGNQHPKCLLYLIATAKKQDKTVRVYLRAYNAKDMCFYDNDTIGLLLDGEKDTYCCYYGFGKPYEKHLISLMSSMVQNDLGRSDTVSDRKTDDKHTLQLRNPYDPDNSNSRCSRLLLGIGGFGTETIKRLAREYNVDASYNLDIVACDMDFQQLNYSDDIKGVLAIGDLGGLGSGGSPDRAFATIKQNIRQLKNLIMNRDSIILTCGMGGGFGSAGIVSLSALCSCFGIKTEAYISTPEETEGTKRNSQAKEFLRLLENYIPCSRIHIVKKRDLASRLLEALDKNQQRV